MKIDSIFRFVFDHPHQSIGLLCALIVGTIIVLLFRYIGQSSQPAKSESVNLEAIEGAFKKVLSETSVNVAPESIINGEVHPDVMAAAAANPEQAAKLNEALAEREKKIVALTQELEQAKANAAAASSAGGGGADPIQNLELENKVRDLEARLAEYSIIEDDIADLSMFKEENVKLKEEVEALKAQLGSGGGGGAAAAPTPAPEPVPTSGGPSVEVPFQPSDKFELDPNDDVMKEFAAAVQEADAPPPQAAGSADLAASIAAMNQAPAAAAADPQAEIDAMMNAAAAEASAPQPEAPAPPVGSPQDAMEAILNAEAMESIAEPQAASPPDLKVVPPMPAEPAAQAEAVPVAEAEDPLAGELNPEKVAAEVASLEAAGEGDSVLNDTLDTDKLLAEVDALGGPQTNVPAHDDLMSEFKDVAKGNG